jgi:hypothetical protein
MGLVSNLRYLRALIAEPIGAFIASGLFPLRPFGTSSMSFEVLKTQLLLAFPH